MSQIYPAALSHFAVFCPELGPDEDNSHEQLLFYAAAALPAFYPCSPNDYFARSPQLRWRSSSGSSSTITGATTSMRPKAEGAASSERVVSLDTKLREIGLGAALVAFARTFTGESADRFHFVRSEKRRTVVFEAEPGVLIQLALVLPRRVKAFGREKDAYSVEFLDHQVSDQALRTWLTHEYWSFFILYGPLRRVLRSGADRRLVRRQLDMFFGRTLARWDSRWAEELSLVPSLAPVPRLAVGAISLGGFDQLWHDLCMLEEMCHLVVMWKGSEVVWSSIDNDVDKLRALVAWSRAIYSPVFSANGKQQAVAKRASPVQISNQTQQQKSKPASSSLLASGAWLWGWGSSSKPSSITGTATVASTEATAIADPTVRPRTGIGSRSGSIISDVNNEQDGNEESDDDEESDGNNNQNSSRGLGGGIAQALSRAVNALVEPRPPTPPEEDPALEPSDLHIPSEQYTLSAADVEALQIQQSQLGGAIRESDAESLRSVGSLASVRTTATAAIGVNRMNVARTRSNTTQTGNGAIGLLSSWQPQPHMMSVPRHMRTPSVTSNFSTGTVDSTQVLRDDTRVSSRSWWPQTWGWGGTASAAAPAVPPVPVARGEPLVTVPESELNVSGVDPSTTFLYTGEYPFPGMSTKPTDRSHIHRQSEDAARDYDSSSERNENDSDAEEPSIRLELAMDEEMPSVYEHGVNIDTSRGLVLAPRAITGMMYDTRLLRALYGTSSEADGICELPLHMQNPSTDLPFEDKACKTLVYKYGEMLFFVFGHSNARSHTNTDTQAESEADPMGTRANFSEQVTSMQSRRKIRAQQRRGGGGGRKNIMQGSTQVSDRFSASEAQRVEEVLLRYAESIHAATLRDSEEIEAHNAAVTKRRIPPFVSIDNARRLVQTNWASCVPLNRSYLGFVQDHQGAKHTSSEPKLPSNVRMTLEITNVELERGGNTNVCVRMQNKGWVAAASRDQTVCYCVVDQPKATLADAQTFLARASKMYADL
ncbi:hypothetical protein LPJ73_000800 [Coemansia sp. RSA 2703]|nr:hypothetical protein LPJ73_000800 [Coemansia sp. RSA 2703]KAJ2376564.1 hypothetical protein IW150_001906 [Coemansia sp. RSA 2607]KAJ2397698.1 hypothetical protein GGI05_000509 [Coemansia sp. RSA 2603]